MLKAWICRVKLMHNAYAKKNKSQNPQFIIIKYKNEFMWAKLCSDKFGNAKVSENSPYVEIYSDFYRRAIVKKTSFCWLLRNDHARISSDKLERVKNHTRSEKGINIIYNPV